MHSSECVWMLDFKKRQLKAAQAFQQQQSHQPAMTNSSLKYFQLLKDWNIIYSQLSWPISNIPFI